MLEISTSGLMSGDGKRSGLFRAQPPRPSSTLLIGISVVAAFLFAAVNAIEPDRRLALALKFLIVFVTAVAVAARLMP